VGACTFAGAWDLWAGQTADLATSDPSTVHFATGQITSTPMHVGDICNLGIACVPNVSNRNLLDFISVAIDPVGCAHIAFADDNKINRLLVANEIVGCFTTAGGGPGRTPTPAPGAASTPSPNSSSAAPGQLAGALASLALGLFGLRLRSRRRRV
jgi:hypothetical protein